MNIGFVGLGYVGLVSAVAMADFGHNVIGFDQDEEKIDKLNKKILPIDEEGLEERFITNIKSGNLTFSNNYDANFSKLDAIFITVGTPSNDNGDTDLSFIYNALDSILEIINHNTLIIVKSTVPPGTCKELQKYVYNSKKSNEIASNPEFLREGRALFDFTNPDRLVFGCITTQAADVLKKIYHSVISNNIPVIITCTSTAELIKGASNSFLATKIVFINEIANLCDKLKIDVDQVSLGIGLDKRIGKAFLKAGPGYGGSCFPKDNLSLLRTTESNSCKSMIIESVINSNNDRIEKIVSKIKMILGNFSGRHIAILGLSFKAGTDDTRDSPSIKIIRLLLLSNIYIKAYDPKAKILDKDLLNDHRFSHVHSIEEATKDSMAIVIATEWPEFLNINYKDISSLETKPTIIDLRNILDKNYISELGLKYFAIGNGV